MEFLRYLGMILVLIWGAITLWRGFAYKGKGKISVRIVSTILGGFLVIAMTAALIISILGIVD